MACFRTIIPFVALALLFFTFSEGKENLVGGKENSWTAPSSSSNTLAEWAGKTRFTVGDILLWKYDPESESVLEVTKDKYEKCSTLKPIKKHSDGNTKILLDRSGPFYFISGSKDQCEKGQKLIVVVMSEHNYNHGYIASVPAPSLEPYLPPSTGTAAAPGLSLCFVIGVGSLMAVNMILMVMMV